ncbi:MAG: cytochrome c-type biosis protein CcmE [Clostridia bacterium]|nr:cytochrome c-type biosis protein CcmE [Clostridia bacterium]
MKLNRKVALSALLVVVAIAYLIISGFSGNTGRQYSVGEIVRQADALEGQPLTTEGKVVAGSIRWDREALELRFTLTDGQERLEVRYPGVPPDNLDYPGVQVIVKGRYDAAGHFLAVDSVQTRCPSKYEALEEQGGDSSGERREEVSFRDAD